VVGGNHGGWPLVIPILRKKNLKGGGDKSIEGGFIPPGKPSSSLKKWLYWSVRGM
jgi:hypothetical protein